MRNINSIFVYGSLQLGMKYDAHLKKLKGRWKKGYVHGSLINIHTGVNYGYPGLKIKKKGTKIYGMIFQSKNLKKKIKFLDRFEGNNYKRIITDVRLLSGRKIKAYMYELIIEKKGRPVAKRP